MRPTVLLVSLLALAAGWTTLELSPPAAQAQLDWDWGVKKKPKPPKPKPTPDPNDPYKFKYTPPRPGQPGIGDCKKAGNDCQGEIDAGKPGLWVSFDSINQVIDW
jgi:hypothetical protein